MSDASEANMKAAAYATNNKCYSLLSGKPNLDCARYINPMTTTNLFIFPFVLLMVYRGPFNCGHCISFSVIRDL